jgi:hypothetical protein
MLREMDTSSAFERSGGLLRLLQFLLENVEASPESPKETAQRAQRRLRRAASL